MKALGHPRQMQSMAGALGYGYLESHLGSVSHRQAGLGTYRGGVAGAPLDEGQVKLVLLCLARS